MATAAAVHAQTVSVIKIDGTDLGPNYPIFSQTYDAVRIDEQGCGIKKNMLTLKGFVDGDNEQAIITKYLDLEALTTKNAVTVEITGLLNRTMYWESYNEPEEWKQYDGEYEFKFYWFDNITPNNEATASFNGFNFPKLPQWSRKVQTNKSDGILDTLNSGNKIQLTLTGVLVGTSLTDVMSKIAAMEAAVYTGTGVGTLAYGGFSQTCGITSFQIAPVVPLHHAVYTLELEYYDSDVIRIEVTRESTRTHFNPVIDEQPFCGRRVVQILNPSAQEVVWTVTVQAKDLDTAYAQVSAELTARVADGGIELPGGTQKQDENTNTVTVSTRQWYDIPILANL